MIPIRWKKGKDSFAGRVISAVVKNGKTYLVVYLDDGTFKEVPIGDVKPW